MLPDTVAGQGRARQWLLCFLDECLVIHVFLDAMQSYYSEERALSLWDALVLNPVQPSDRDLGYKFVQVRVLLVGSAFDMATRDCVMP